MRKALRWLPAGLLTAGALAVQTVARQQPMSLRAPLTSLPAVLDGMPGRDLPLSEEEQRVAGMSSYLSRVYGADGVASFQVYVGYYESQTQGHTIHSPRNCLPGAGWEPMAAAEVRLATMDGSVPANRYLIANKSQRAVVYYWYQGRGRVSANEYRVKWELLRDASLRRRTDEALVRIVVPIRTTEEAADAVARGVARQLLPEVQRVLPA